MFKAGAGWLVIIFSAEGDIHSGSAGWNGSGYGERVDAGDGRYAREDIRIRSPVSAAVGGVGVDGNSLAEGRGTTCQLYPGIQAAGGTADIDCRYILADEVAGGGAGEGLADLE